MSKLVFKNELINDQNSKNLIAICPFGALSYVDGKMDVSSSCKMCKLCVLKGGGLAEIVEEEEKTVDKTLWNGVLVYVDHGADGIHRVTFELAAKAKELASKINHPVYALIIGNNLKEKTETLRYYGFDKIFVYEDKAFEDFKIEPYTAAFFDFIEKVKPSSVMLGATNLGRQLAPRIAARCKAGLTADCTILEMKDNTDLVQIRPAFGGNIMAQIISPNTRPQFCTVRYKIFNEPKKSDEPTGEIINMSVTDDMLKSAVQILSTTTKPRETDISESDVIVAIGRGAASETTRTLAAELAELLGGNLACTRPLVEANTFDAKHQIGLSGRTVKPKFIVCLGISGSVQFAAGMKASDCIVAINSDPNAQIFDVAHFGIVGDVNEILPALISKIKEVK